MNELAASFDRNASSPDAPPYRPDVRERLQGAANEMHLLQATSVALVSDFLVEERADWSEPIEMRIVREQDGIVSLEFRKPK